MKTLIILVCCFLGVEARADIFVRGAAGNTAIKEMLTKDRAGYYYRSPGLDARQAENKVSDLDELSSGMLTRDRGLYDIDGSFNKAFATAFSKDGSFDRYRTARNNLLLLEYSSPALADVIKHYRVMTAQRLALDEQRLADIEKSTETPLDRMSRLSERACLRGKAGEGLVSAMQACKASAQPFDALPLVNGQGSLADGRRNIHVVRDSLALLGFAEKNTADKVAALSGDVIITDDDYRQVLAKETFTSRVEYYRAKSAGIWQDSMEDLANGAKVPQGLPELSLPGVPMTQVVLNGVMVLDAPSRAVVIAKLSSFWARAQTVQEYTDALMYLEYARQLPQLPGEFAAILTARAEYIKALLDRADSAGSLSEGYRTMLAGLMNDADHARAGLLASGTSASDDPAILPAELMVSVKEAP
ncbi:MAG: hypothetical protein HQL20_07655 [Candidatus Omnitrophica bacterium]|nr:hypothetical protein [Candidatus Omnitrophota bacterium]